MVSVFGKLCFGILFGVVVVLLGTVTPAFGTIGLARFKDDDTVVDWCRNNGARPFFSIDVLLDT